MAKRVLVLNGHPGGGSFCGALCAEYVAGARRSGAEVRLLNLEEMVFDADLGGGFDGKKELEPALADFQHALTWCQHFVIVHPLWWGMMPAKLKGLIDRALLPGYAFSYRADSPLPDGLLEGRSAEVIVTADTPGWYLHLVYRAGGFRALKTQVLQFCGVKPVRFRLFSPVRGSNSATRDKWLGLARRYGAAA